VQTWTVITESLDLLEAAAAAVSDASRQATTPCAQWTVTQILQHAAGDQLAWAAAIGVGTGPAENPFAPSGRLEAGVDELVKPALAVARAAWESVKAGDDAVPTPLP
jgi:Mycothiol maleylpyruvate isomerase N-terminal domain